ncbi:MAG: hypothetical protein WDN75_15800 [Bacteroidota bacterium]
MVAKRLPLPDQVIAVTGLPTSTGLLNPMTPSLYVPNINLPDAGSSITAVMSLALRFPDLMPGLLSEFHYPINIY